MNSIRQQATETTRYVSEVQEVNDEKSSEIEVEKASMNGNLKPEEDKSNSTNTPSETPHVKPQENIQNIEKDDCNNQIKETTKTIFVEGPVGFVNYAAELDDEADDEESISRSGSLKNNDLHKTNENNNSSNNDMPKAVTKLSDKESASSVQNGIGIRNVNNQNVNNQKSTKGFASRIAELVKPVRHICCTGMFWGMLIFNLPCHIAYISSLVYLPAYGIEMGLTVTESSGLLSMIGGMELIARIGYGYLGDRPWADRRVIISLCYWTCGAATLTLTFFRGMYTVYAYAAVMSLLGGIHMVYAFPLYTEILNPKDLPPAMGISQMCNGIVLSVTQVPLGSLQTITGTFSSALQCASGMYITGATLCMITKLITLKFWKRTKEYAVNV